VPKKRKAYRPDLGSEARKILDAFVRLRIINYSSWDECYFYLDKNGQLIVLDFLLYDLLTREVDDKL
jgi:hypothetical protein